MANMFETVVLNMQKTGMYQFLLPFLLSLAIFYGLLRKSRIFGEPREVLSINAVVAVVASFMVWSAPIILGVNIEQSLASFFVQGMTATLIIIVFLLIAGLFFPPDLAKHLSERLNQPKYAMGFLIFAGVIAAAIFFSSGIINVFLPEGLRFTLDDITPGAISEIFALVLIVGAIVFITWGGGEK
jgi:hypothetical protein